MQIGFIGVGKIASAIIKGICNSDLKVQQITLSPRNEIRSKQLSSKYNNVYVAENNQAVIDQSEMIFVALRPGDFDNILSQLSFKENQTIISLNPFSELENVKRLVSPATSVTRAIPLPPVVNHQCPIPIYPDNNIAKILLNHIGQVSVVNNETDLHTLWTVTGMISPFYDLMDQLSEWAIDKGVNERIAKTYVADFLNSLSAAAIADKEKNYKEMAQHAATPGGMNEHAGKLAKERDSFSALIEAANDILKRFDR